MDINSILSCFGGVRRIKYNAWQVKCPCHADSTASLTVTDAGDKILMYCHAGCNTADIVSAVNLTMADLNNSAPKNSWKDRFTDLEAVYDYGEYVKLRLAGKKILYGHIEGDSFVGGMPQGISKTLYRLNDVKQAIEKGMPVYITEGEKDADTMSGMGFPCCTPGGCGDWDKTFAVHFTGAKVVILPDNDEPGIRLAEQIKRDLRHTAAAVKVVRTSISPKGDVTDYINEGHTKSDLLELIKSEEWELAPWIGKNKKVNPDLLAESISQSLDYIALQKKGTEVADFYIYKNGVYCKCSKIEFKAIIKGYIPLGYANDNTLNNVYNLLLCSHRKIFDFEDVNTDENIINVKNGLYDIKTGQLKPHTKAFLSTLQLNCQFNKNTICPNWHRYIDALCTDKTGSIDNDKAAVLQEWFGLILSNVNVARVKKCLALYSSLGNTGKSVFLSVLRKLLGEENTINIPMQVMAARFALSDLYGKRADIVGDQSAEDIEDSSAFKQLTGGDAVKVEFKGKQSFDFIYRGAIVISCNNLPFFKDDKGGHIFERFTIINCENVIPPERRDGTLIDKLIKEADGIFIWAMDGLKRLVDNDFKFTKCKAVDSIVSEYRGEVDTFFKFISNNYEITFDKKDKVLKTELEGSYTRWCAMEEYNAMKKRNIKERAEKSGIILGKSDGLWYYKGIKPVHKIEKVEDEEELPKEFRQTKIDF